MPPTSNPAAFDASWVRSPPTGPTRRARAVTPTLGLTKPPERWDCVENPIVTADAGGRGVPLSSDSCRNSPP